MSIRSAWEGALIAIAAATVFIGGSMQRAQAMPPFAQANAVDCSACHTMMPALNAYGRYIQRTAYGWTTICCTLLLRRIELRRQFQRSVRKTDMAVGLPLGRTRRGTDRSRLLGASDSKHKQASLKGPRLAGPFSYRALSSAVSACAPDNRSSQALQFKFA